MSSILKALRKLEEETPTHGDSQPYPVDVKKTVENGVIKKQRYFKFFLIVFSAIFIISVSLFLLSRQTAPTKKNVPNSIPIVRKGIPDRPKTENVKIASVPDSKSRKRRAKPSSGIKKAKNLPGYSKMKTSASRAVRKKKPYRSNHTKPKPAKSSLPFKSAAGSGLKLQAIAWSSDPKQSIAVVNGRILREGSSVEGTLIIKIDKNDVSFQKGGEQWRQKFGPQ
ncbi:MAG: hypothetical protein SWH54_12205 [Thermodesulfobacteriota bacterium]|nr:hypothetical protein [Thermodesulfobacteriota bacterium]